MEEVRTIEKEIVFEKEFVEIEKIVPYVRDVYQEVRVTEEVPVLKTIPEERIVEVDRFIEKLTTESTTIVDAREIRVNVEVPVEQTKLVTKNNEYPVVVEVNRIIEAFVDRCIEIPVIMENIKEVPVIE